MLGHAYLTFSMSGRGDLLCTCRTRRLLSDGVLRNSVALIGEGLKSPASTLNSPASGDTSSRFVESYLAKLCRSQESPAPGNAVALVLPLSFLLLPHVIYIAGSQ
jgi:hypothetical protein